MDATTLTFLETMLDSILDIDASIENMRAERPEMFAPREYEYAVSLPRLLVGDYQTTARPYLRFVNIPRAPLALREFLDSLYYKDYYQAVEICRYAPFHIDDRDLLYMLFISFGDHCADVLHIDMWQLYTAVFTSGITDVPDPVRNDIEAYKAQFVKMGVDIQTYKDIIKTNVKAELMQHDNTARSVLRRRLFSNYAMVSGLRYTALPKPLMLSFFTIFFMFDDVDDVLDDIANNTPTYISWLRENTPCEKAYITSVNKVLYYTYHRFAREMYDYNRGYYCMLDMCKSVYLAVV